MDLKGTLKAITLELRRELDGRYDAQGTWQSGDLARRLAALGVRPERASVPVDELPQLTPEDREARRVIDAYLQNRAEAGQRREAAVAEFTRDAAYTWANRLLALRCMEARELIDEVVLQKGAYGGRSLQHNRLAKKQPERCIGDDEGLFAALFDEFARRARELPLLFDPRSPAVALRPSVAALKRCIALLSGTVTVKGQEAASDDVFKAPDALGWTYQYWNIEEKDRVFEKVRTKKGSKIEGAEIVPATCIYTEPYMVKFLVQNSLGATWMGMHPDSRLTETWTYYVRGADRAPVTMKPVADLTFLDPACGSGHFLIEAFELFYAMYVEEGTVTDPARICASILERNLYGIDIDERAVQIAALALVMKAREKAPDFAPRRVNLVATNIRLPAGKEHLNAFLRKHPEDTPLKPALLAIFEGLAHADELGSLLQIEEPVDRELRHLRKQQLDREREAGAGSLFGPRKEEDWAAWRHEAVGRLREHFSAEAREADLATAFFGEAASKGVTLVELLSRRYDIVAANPPYMGSKNMGPVLKKFVEHHFAPGKRDVYAAFILRCLQLAAEGGRVAMVTQQSWMFLRSFAALRAVDEETLKTAPKSFGGVIRETSIEALAHLGPRAFGEVTGEVVNTVLFVFARTKPSSEHRLTAFRLVGPKTPGEKDSLLCDALRGISGEAGTKHLSVSRPLQARFLTVTQAPLCYWFRERIFELLAGRTLGGVADVCQGLATADDARYVRFAWEASDKDWSRPAPQRRYVPFEKGGGYGKWFGHQLWVVEWQYQGTRIKATGRAYARNEDRYFARGWTYTWVARGSLGVRWMSEPAIIAGAASSGIYQREPHPAIAAVLSCRFSSTIVRGLSGKIQLPESSVARVPVPDTTPSFLDELESSAVAVKRHLVALDSTERSFRGIPLCGTSLTEAWRRFADQTDAVAALLHTIEGLSEREVFRAFDITGDDLQAVLDETGTPAGWSPLITGYDAVPEHRRGLSLPVEALESLARQERCTLSSDTLAQLKRRLRDAHEAGRGHWIGEEDAANGDDEDEDENEDVPGARVPIPTETLLEELAQKLEIHPISVYWLLRELREKEGVVSKPELVRFTEDYLSVLVLRLLGHRWPREIESHEASPPWADADGIIPLTEDATEPSLLGRVRERLAVDFGAEHAHAVERESAEITGRPLAGWLSTDFFKRHVTQFRKRPIAWQLRSVGNNSTRRRGRGAVRGTPTFACLVYYHRLDADLLPKVRTQYLGPLRTSLQTELNSLEKLRERSSDQDARRLELEGKVEELRAFDEVLAKVCETGFAAPMLTKFAVDDAVLQLKSLWLWRLSSAAIEEAVPSWRRDASQGTLPEALVDWVATGLAELNRCCVTVGPIPEPPADSASAEVIAQAIAAHFRGMVAEGLRLATGPAFARLDREVFKPLREELRELNTQRTGLERQPRAILIEDELRQKTRAAERLQKDIEGWAPSDLTTWEAWLAQQPLYDQLSARDPLAQPPRSVQAWIAQESRYSPDLNDGVRVNIAPLQRAGLLAADVLAPKDLEKAIADRAEWRADERRWCREGKLPQPGWWPAKDKG
ncbi:MAG: BREX-1 system adenine-specific DNA-methyltransferase PglX [Deltaproteobacteria bacterium]|nr:BREX-1 system adenine-specific DNA-methyltransferase PglX [Deltaproteobacteria bacterium]